MKKRLVAFLTGLMMMSSVAATAFAGDFEAVEYNHAHDDICSEIVCDGEHTEEHVHDHEEVCADEHTEEHVHDHEEVCADVHTEEHVHDHEEVCADEHEDTCEPETIKVLEASAYNSPANVDEMVVVAATIHIHTYNSSDTKYKNATCTEPPMKIETCRTCGYVRRTTTGTPLGHKTTEKVVAPTCEEKGYTETKCTRSDCTYYSQSNYTSALGHDKSISKKDPTCEGSGYTITKCKRSGCNYYNEVTHKPLGHATTEKVVKPTCEKQGYTEKKCTRSGCNYYDKVTHKPLGHATTEKVVKPTCEKQGYTEKKCTRSGCNYYDKVTHKPLKHDYLIDTKDPTCEGSGYTITTCKRKGCNYYDKVTHKPLGHKTTENVVPATCEADGYTLVSCTREGCDFTEKKDPKPKLGHDEFVATVKKAPTCTENGTQIIQCRRCNYNKEETVKKLGHTYKRDSLPADCSNPQREVKICTKCGYYEVLSTQYKPLGHDVFMATQIKAPTCSEEGRAIYQCRRCNESYEGSVDMIPHRLAHGTVIEQPTCSSEGLAVYQCTRCQHNETQPLTRVPCEYVKVGMYKAATCTTHQQDIYKCFGCGGMLYGVTNYDVPYAHEYAVYTYWGADYETGDGSTQDYNEFSDAPAECTKCGTTIDRVDFRVANVTNEFTNLHITDAENETMSVTINTSHPTVMRANADWVVMECDGNVSTNGVLVVPAGINTITVTVDPLAMKDEIIEDRDAIYTAAIKFSALVEGKEFKWKMGFGGDDVDLCGVDVNIVTDLNEDMICVIEKYSDNDEVYKLMTGLTRTETIQSFASGNEVLFIYSPELDWYLGNRIRYLNCRVGFDPKYAAAGVFEIRVLHGYGMSIGNVEGEDLITSYQYIRPQDVSRNSYDYYSTAVRNTIEWAIDKIFSVISFTPTELLDSNFAHETFVSSIEEGFRENGLGILVDNGVVSSALENVFSKLPDDALSFGVESGGDIVENFMDYLKESLLNSIVDSLNMSEFWDEMSDGIGTEAIFIDNSDDLILTDNTVNLPEGCFLEPQSGGDTYVAVIYRYNQDYRFDVAFNVQVFSEYNETLRVLLDGGTYRDTFTYNAQ